MLVAPLDWGLGHATRCIPIIRALQQQGHTVVLACSGAQQQLLQQEFPSLQMLTLPGYNISYSRKKWKLPFKIGVQIPKIIKTIRREHAWLQQVIDEHHIDAVISDNRYGLHSTKVPCIFMTHQLHIKTPYAWLEKRLQRINYNYIEQFTACWVPDVADKNLNVAGSLSHPETLPRVPVTYIGLLSRFEPAPQPAYRYKYCFLISGPEPQRTLLEDAALDAASQLKGDCLVIRGLPGNNDGIEGLPPHVTLLNHAKGEVLHELIEQSEFIISRSGYTTVMEMLCLQKKMVLVPTPGQTEQEYLAARLTRQRWALVARQHKLLNDVLSAKRFIYTLPSFAVAPLQQAISHIFRN